MAALYLVAVAAVLATASAFPPVSTTTTGTISRRDEILEKNRLADIKCSTNPGQGISPVDLSRCYNRCYFKTLGILDQNGRYVESAMADFLWVQDLPPLRRDQAEAIAKACNTMNDHIEPGCERGTQVDACVGNEMVKHV